MSLTLGESTSKGTVTMQSISHSPVPFIGPTHLGPRRAAQHPTDEPIDYLSFLSFSVFLLTISVLAA